MAEIAAKSGQDGVDIVIDILKDNNLDSIEQGKQLLEKYDYLKNVENVLYQQFLQNIVVTAGGTFFLLAILLSLLWLWQRTILQKDKARFLQIGKTLVDFRENNYEVILELDDEDEQAMSDRLNQSEKQTTSVAIEQVSNRIIYYLEDLAGPGAEDKITVKLPMTRKNIASYLGTTPETLSRKFKELEDAGLINQLPKNEIHIPSIEEMLFSTD
ncbi:MAG: helix-turn-helix domain-containing protein [Aerococcus urinaeequi]|nr:helix-turn-helix domain-containing protein [Aerococcus urinaeequi]